MSSEPQLYTTLGNIALAVALDRVAGFAEPAEYARGSSRSRRMAPMT